MINAGWRTMTARRPDEQHRAATPLELFFDLCFVVAVAQAAAELHHAFAEDHIAHGVVSYLMVFFAIWWAWMNFTWFASAYDTDDVPYRLAILVQIAGVADPGRRRPARLRATATSPSSPSATSIMRLAMVTQWLRAAPSDPPRPADRAALRGRRRRRADRLGRCCCSLPPSAGLASASSCCVVAELAVPVWAERTATTTWHPHHIAERYGLFTLIVLGESVAAATLAIKSAFDTHLRHP